MYIGLDLSINSTGVAIDVDGEIHYKIITPKLTRTQKRIDHDRFEYVLYNKTDDDDDNIYEICQCVENIINQYGVTNVTLEAPAYQAHGRSAITMAGLNYSVRQLLKHMNVNYTLVQPTSLKKWFTGNGCADKNLMCHCWRMLDPIHDELKGIKVDDIADAYALLMHSNPP